MSKLDLLRKLIREEVVAAIRSELPKILYESKSNVMENVKTQFAKKMPPSTLNTPDTYKKPINFGLDKSNPLSSLLNETAASMVDSEVISFTTDHVNPALAFQPNEVQVGDVSGMLSTARPSSNLDAVQINEVPDYSQLMKKMLDRGTM